jgi:hypothetical protein
VSYIGGAAGARTEAVQAEQSIPEVPPLEVASSAKAAAGSAGTAVLEASRALRGARSTSDHLADWVHPQLSSHPQRADQMAAVASVEGIVPMYARRCLFDEGFVLQDPLFADCSVVLGLHPDQATEPIVRACLQARKPFAVVPCCVFPDTNTHRRTPGGAPVRSLGQFVEYLVALGSCGEIEVGQMPAVGGCNTVVHYRLRHI